MGRAKTTQKTAADGGAGAEPPRRWERILEALLGLAASAILLAMMLLTFVDVAGRYVLSWPVPGGFELTELMLLVLIFAGLPLVSHADEHVTMDFIDRLVSDAVRAALVRIVHLATASVMFVLAWLVWRKAGQIAGYGDASDVLGLP